jgi:hypothetical protein
MDVIRGVEIDRIDLAAVDKVVRGRRSSTTRSADPSARRR